MLMLLAAFAATVTMSCLDERNHPIAPKAGIDSPLLEGGVPEGCARFQVQANPGETAVLDTIYNTAYCGNFELKLIHDSAAVFDAGTGTLRVPVVLKNVSTVTVVEHVRIRYNADSTKMYNANNEVVPGPTTIVGHSADSANTNSRITFWLYDTLLAPSGQPQTLAPGATSRRKWLEFRGTDWDKRVRLKLYYTGHQGATVPALPPDSIPAFFRDPTSWLVNPSFFAGTIVKNVLEVFFREGATQSERQAAVGLVSGTVVGGIKYFSNGDGSYFIKVASDSSGAALQAAKGGLEAQPKVGKVLYIELGGVRRFSRP